MNKRNFITDLATFGPFGYLPAPGTWGTFLGLIVVYFCADRYYYPTLLTLSFAAAWVIIYYALHYSHKTDPQVIIIDECVGILIPYLLVPVTFYSLVYGFLLFRFFDITKCCGVKFFERCPGPCGILLDDCFAGILTGAFLLAAHV